MIQIETTSHDPFFNQAFEDYVFRTYREGDVLLLWRNRPAVVVGCYQNICRGGACACASGQGVFRRAPDVGRRDSLS